MELEIIKKKLRSRDANLLNKNDQVNQRVFIYHSTSKNKHILEKGDCCLCLPMNIDGHGPAQFWDYPEFQNWWFNTLDWIGEIFYF